MNLILRYSIIKSFRTQWEFARAMGVHESYVSDVLHGKRNPSLKRKNKWAKALGSSVDELFQDNSDAMARH